MERELAERAKNLQVVQKKEIDLTKALQDADILLSNPQITDYHVEPNDKIMLVKRTFVDLNRSIISPKA